MALAVVVTPGHTFPDRRPVTLAALRKAALPSVSISGSIGSGDIAAGAVNTTHIRPDAYFYTGNSAFSSNTYVMSLNPALTALAPGVVVRFKADTVNTTASSINVNGLGAVLIKKNKSEDLAAGDIRQDQIVEVRYDGTYWQMISQLGNVPNYYQGTETGAANAYAIAVSPAPAALADIVGKPIRFKAVNANTGASTLAINALTATAIKKAKDLDLLANDIKAGQIVELVYDGTVFQMQSQIGNGVDADTAIVAQSRNLVMDRASATTVTVTADYVVLVSSGDKPYLAKNVNLTLNISSTASNPLALDTGGEANSTWYYVWLIYNGTAVSGVFSASRTAPTLAGALAGYTHTALVGQVYNDGSGDFVAFHQNGRDVIFAEQIIGTNKNYASGAWNVISGSDLTNFQAAVPPNATKVSGTIGSIAGSGGVFGIAADANGLGGMFFNAARHGDFFSYGTASPFSMALTAQSVAVRSDGTARCRWGVSGYSF